MKFNHESGVVEAVQFVDSDAPLPNGVRRGEQAEWAGGPEWQSFFNKKYGAIYKYYVDTPEGPVRILLHDWVITKSNGNQYPCNDAAFKKAYKVAE